MQRELVVRAPEAVTPRPRTTDRYPWMLTPLIAAVVVAACAGAQSTSSPTPSAIAAARSTKTADATASPRPAATPSPGPYEGLTVVDVDAQTALLLGREVGNLGITTKFVWAATSQGLVRLDPKSMKVDDIDEVPRFGLAADMGAVWMTDFASGDTSRLDPATATQTVSVQLSGNPESIAVFGDSVWVAQHRGGSVTRLKEPSGKVLAVIEVGPTGAGGPHGIVADKTAVWAGVHNNESVVRIDPATNTVVATIKTTTSPCGPIAATPDAVWVSTCFDDHFAIRNDPRTNTLVSEIDLGGFNGGPIVVDGYPWFPVANQLVRVDPAINRVDRIARFAKSAEFAAYGTVLGFDSVWIGGQGRIARIPITALRD